MIISLLLKQYVRSTEQKAVYNRITPVIEFLQRNYSKKIKISDLSEILHICDDHFIRLFKQHTNKTPTKFITDLRIENAMKMLAQTEQPISEISVAVGFQSPNYMCKAFKQTLGMTPNQYRKTRHN